MNYFAKLADKVNRLRAKYPYCPRKAALSMLNWSAKNLFFKSDSSGFADGELHIAVGVYGGLGDMFFAARYVSGLARYLGKKVDVFTDEYSFDYVKALFENSGIVNQIAVEDEIRGDVKIKIVRYPEVVFCDTTRLNKVGTDREKSYINRLTDFQNANPLLYQNDYFGRCFAKVLGKKREDEADIDGILGLTDVEWDIPAKNPNFSQPFITLQTGAGLHFKDIKSDTRQWDEKQYEQLTALLKREYPRFKIVQIGAEYQDSIRGVDLDLRGKTSTTEMFGVLKQASLHIQQEGGLAIARHYLCRKPSVVLFGPTDAEFFGFPENINLRAAGFDCVCEWLTKDWMVKCVKTGETAACMRALSAQTVFEKIKESRILE